MNVYQTHAILKPIVMTPKVPLCVNAIMGILEMVLTVLVSISSIRLGKITIIRAHNLFLFFL